MIIARTETFRDDYRRLDAACRATVNKLIVLMAIKPRERLLREAGALDIAGDAGSGARSLDIDERRRLAFTSGDDGIVLLSIIDDG